MAYLSAFRRVTTTLIVLVSALSVGCAIEPSSPSGEVTGARLPSTTGDGDCSPIDPTVDPSTQSLPPCFWIDADPDDLSKLTLNWIVADSAAGPVYLANAQNYQTDPGFRARRCAQQDPPPAPGGCSEEVTIEGGGEYEFRIVVSGAGETVSVSDSISIAPPPSPSVGDSVHVDMMNPTDATISWVVAQSDPRAVRDWVEIKNPGGFGWPLSPTELPLSGSTSISLSEPGQRSALVRYCMETTAGAEAGKLCSEPTRAGIIVGPARWNGPHRISVPSGQDLTLTHTADSGNLWVVESESLVPTPFGDWITTNSYTIPAAELTPGYHHLKLASCHAVPGLWRCSNREDAEQASVAGTVQHVVNSNPYLADLNLYSEGDVMARIVEASDSTNVLEWIVAPADGRGYFFGNDGDSVSAGDDIGIIITPNVDMLHIVVDDPNPVAWDMGPDGSGRPYTDDFEDSSAGGSRAFTLSGKTSPLDVAYGPDGTVAEGIWVLGEFTWGVHHVDTSAGLSGFLQAPLIRGEPFTNDVGDMVAHPVEPFAGPFGVAGQQSATSQLGEYVTTEGSGADARVWYTQGGTMFHSGPEWNYSRVVAFDPNGADLPSTEYDDRLCGYHVPLDNASVTGLATAGGRVWLGSMGTSSIISFVPTAELCQQSNRLNYDDPASWGPQDAPEVCQGNQTPEQHGCFEVSALPAGVRVAHLAADPTGDALWLVDMLGENLARFDISTRTVTDTWVLPAASFNLDGSAMELFGAYPWTLRVTSEAVYFSEYNDRDIVRLDRNTGNVSEVHVPYQNRHVNIHSLDIDVDPGPMGHTRLWFTLSNESHAPEAVPGDTLGYIDLDSWDAFIAGQTSTIDGVIYSGLHDVNSIEEPMRDIQSFRGLDVHEQTGNIALASAARRQVTELVPRCSFRSGGPSCGQ